MNRRLLSLPGEQLALVVVIVVAIVGLSLVGNNNAQGAVNYASEYRTNVTACDIAGFGEGMTVTRFAAMRILEQDGVPCYQINTPEDWYCCKFSNVTHWTRQASEFPNY